ncbi:MAG: ABC transporter ATP-binding protein [Sneathiellaceae bacterium]
MTSPRAADPGRVPGPAAGPAPALSLSGVSHSYGDGLSVQQASLTIAPGEIVCLLGPSGCGKTTLLRLAAGLETPLAGQIRLGGEVVAEAGRSVAPEDRHVGLVFQDIALFPHLDLLDNVAFGLRGPRSQTRAAAARWLERVDLGHLLRAWPHMLSGGEQQRVALARALAPSPRLLLMDEPFSSLDPHLRHRLRGSTLELLRQAGVPALIVTHDAEEAMTMADRVVVMRDGALVQSGTPDQIYTAPSDIFAARLFGPLNEWPGVVRQDVVETPLGRLPAPGMAAGQKVVVAVRAEGVYRRAPDAGAGTAGLPARVQQVLRLGPDCLVRLGGNPALPEQGAGPAAILMRCRRDLTPAVDAQVVLTMDPEMAFIYPDPGETP